MKFGWFKILMAVALISSSLASSADTKGLLAEVDRADVNLQASTTVFGHQTVYASFLTNKALGDAFAALLEDAGRLNVGTFQSSGLVSPSRTL